MPKTEMIVMDVFRGELRDLSVLSNSFAAKAQIKSNSTAGKNNIISVNVSLGVVSRSTYGKSVQWFLKKEKPLKDF